MTTATKRKTSLTLTAATLDAARAYGVNVSAIADAAIEQAVEDARQRKWLQDNAAAFDAQAKWHEKNDHPLAEIIMSPAGATWKP